MLTLPKHSTHFVMAQALSRRLIFAEALVQYQSSATENVVGKVALRQVSKRLLQFSPVSIIPPMSYILSFKYHRRYIISATGSVVK